MSFKKFLDEVDKPYTQIEKSKKEPAEISAVRSEYILKTEYYRKEINKSKTVIDKYILCLKLFTELTGDKLFYENNIKILEETNHGV